MSNPDFDSFENNPAFRNATVEIDPSDYLELADIPEATIYEVDGEGFVDEMDDTNWYHGERRVQAVVTQIRRLNPDLTTSVLRPDEVEARLMAIMLDKIGGAL